MLLLITRPYYDEATHYIFHWANELIKEAERKKVNCIDLEKDKATKSKFQSYLGKKGVDVVIINGHGNIDSVCGHDGEVILSTSDGTHLLKNKNIFIRACSAGAILGPAIISSGAKGFIGYSQPFMFPLDKESLKNPLNDELAKPCLECSNQVGISLIKGKSIKEAQKDSLKKYEEKMNDLLSTKTPNSFILPFLHWNKMFQVCYERENINCV